MLEVSKVTTVILTVDQNHAVETSGEWIHCKGKQLYHSHFLVSFSIGN